MLILMLPRRRDAGFTLVETLVGLSLTLLLTSATMGLLNPAASATVAQPEATDLQQRARVAAETVSRHLAAAGTGLATTPQRGALARSFPPVVPRRLGTLQPDASSIARSDAITLWSVAEPLAGARLQLPLADSSSPFIIVPRPGCPAPVDLCGLDTGAAVLVFDDTGRFAAFTLTDATAGIGHLAPRQQNAGYPYPAGATAAPLTAHTYYLDAAAHQLRHYDGHLTDTPVVDHVVDLQFEYFGQPEPPAWPRPSIGTANCLYDAQGAALGGLAFLPPAGASLAPLPLTILRDGPWCGAGDTAFDADLLRVRSVRVTLRLEATAGTSRAAGAGYRHAGTSRSAWTAVPDITATFDVTPRNLNLGR